MSVPSKQDKHPVSPIVPASPIRNQSGAESPTTRPEFNIDSDIEESVVTSKYPSVTTTEEDAPPPPIPPRPLSPQQQAENTLKEAFPSIDATIIKAVLVASGGQVEPAFNALLGVSDPDAVIREPAPPPQPPRRPQASPSQLETDELYARQLAEHYGGGGAHGGRGQGIQRYPKSPEQQRAAQMNYNEEERSFLDDDLPIIKENLRKGFLETQGKVNAWITNWKKKIDGDDVDESEAPRYGATGSRRSGEGRRSGDSSRYDADPQVLGDDFAGIQLNEDGSARRSTRPLANPDLFKPTPSIPKTSDDRHVSFQVDNSNRSDSYHAPLKLPPQESGIISKESKWQPLSTVDPSPIGDPENDPFSLGDSEDEKESKDRVGGKEIRMDDTVRLAEAAAEARLDNITEPAHKPEPAEMSGTKDKVAEDLVTKS